MSFRYKVEILNCRVISSLTLIIPVPAPIQVGKKIGFGVEYM